MNRRRHGGSKNVPKKQTTDRNSARPTNRRTFVAVERNRPGSSAAGTWLPVFRYRRRTFERPGNGKESRYSGKEADIQKDGEQVDVVVVGIMVV
ncbi:unnamed protein product [Calypogeia fissa]